MKTYTVKWEIDIEAKDPIDACKQVLEIMQDKGSSSLVFDVHDSKTGNIIKQVDLWNEE